MTASKDGDSGQVGETAAASKEDTVDQVLRRESPFVLDREHT